MIILHFQLLQYSDIFLYYRMINSYSFIYFTYNYLLIHKTIDVKRQ